MSTSKTRDISRNNTRGVRRTILKERSSSAERVSFQTVFVAFVTRARIRTEHSAWTTPKTLPVIYLRVYGTTRWSSKRSNGFTVIA